MRPRISILIPNLNSGRYIHECIRSIEKQTYDDYEVIIGDSMSDDCSRVALTDYAERDARVKFYDLEREGVYKGWNDCIKMASGDFVHVCTSDDYLAEDFLERVVESIDAHESCELFFTPLRFCDEDSNEDKSKWFEMAAAQYLIRDFSKSQDIVGAEAIIANMVYGSIVVSMNQLVVARQLYEHVGLYRTDLGGSADLVWKYGAYEKNRLRYVPDTYAVWRNHDAQITSSNKKTQLASRSNCREIYWSNQKLRAIHRVELALVYSRIRSGGFFAEQTKRYGIFRGIIMFIRVMMYYVLGWLLGGRKDAWRVVERGVQFCESLSKR